MDSCKQEMSDCSNPGEEQVQSSTVASVVTEKEKSPLRTKLSKTEGYISHYSELSDKGASCQTTRQKRSFKWPLADDHCTCTSDGTLKFTNWDPYSNLTDTCFESNENDTSISRQSTFDSEDVSDNAQLSSTIIPKIEELPASNQLGCEQDLSRTENEPESYVNDKPKVKNHLVLDSTPEQPGEKYNKNIEDVCHLTLDKSDDQEFQPAVKTKEYPIEENTPDLVSDTENNHVFHNVNASSTLKLKPPKFTRVPWESSYNQLHNYLDLKTVASLLPINRNSIEESAFAHILNLETDRSRQNYNLVFDDINWVTGEQDSGVFDLSLVHQEDFDGFDSRETFRDWPARNHTPEQQRQFGSPPSKSELVQPLNIPNKESCEEYSSNLCIPSNLLSDLPLFPGLELSGQHIKPVSKDTCSRETFECDQRLSSLETSENKPHFGQNLSTEILPTLVQEDLISEERSECQLVQSAQNLAEEGSQGLKAEYSLNTCISLPDPLEDINSQSSSMGKKTQSLSKGKQAHMVYSKEEFTEEYASPQKSKSLDKPKNTKKVSEKKEKKKAKDRKRIISDPSQGTEIFISAPILPSKEESVRNKRHTIGAVSTPTQEAGTDTTELLEDNEILHVGVHLQPPQLPVPENESNNNQEQHKSKKRLAHSRAGGISPEIVPTKNPVYQQSSPEVITDTLEEKRLPASYQDIDLIAGGPPLKPKRLSLTNQLQKQSSADKSIDVLAQQNGSASSDTRKGDLCERKTEIAVERQVLLKQATKSTSPHQVNTVCGAEVTRPKIRQQLSSDLSSSYTVVTRLDIDGEEELILGALPLQKIEKQESVGTETPVSSIPGKSDKQPTCMSGRKFRHYACIEPVGQPVQIITPGNKKELFSSRKDPSELNHQESLNQEFLDSTPIIKSLDDIQHDVNVTPIIKPSPPLIVTSPSQDISFKGGDNSPDLPETSSTQCVQSSPEIALMQSPPETTRSLDMNRSRLNSCTDTASTISIPPQSPPDFDYHDLLHQHDQTPSEHSLETPSEPSININFVEMDHRVAQQKMVTVSMAMMPKPQTAEMTIISDESHGTVSTDEDEKQELTEMDQSKSSLTEEELATDLPSTLQRETLQADIPSVSSKDEDEVDGDNDEDEDRGVYDASYRHSDWIYVGNNQELTMMTKQVEQQAGRPQSLQTVAVVNKVPAASDEEGAFDRADEARESVKTTASEKEFQKQYQSLAYRRVHRKTSAIDYQRLSLIARERNVTIKKVNNMFGFRIQYSRPVVVTDIDKGGAAEQAGLRVGDMVLKVNGQDVRQSPHSQVVRLAMSGPDPLDFVVGTNVCNTLNLDADKPVMSGYLHKLGGAGMIRTWKKRWFVLKHDNCLYYYKTEEDVEPLGAIVLCNYTVVKARDVGKSYAFKLTKCKARTYYFYTVTEEEMSRWAKHITGSAKPHNTSDIWLDISTHNVGLPALSIKNPDCQGFLNKLGAVRKAWKKRFCVLKDACLYYYKDMDAQHALGVAHFHGYSIQETEIGSKKFGLVLKPPSAELRIFYFVADHETDRKRWVAAFASSIGRWIQTNNSEESDEESAEMLI